MLDPRAVFLLLYVDKNEAYLHRNYHYVQLLVIDEGIFVEFFFQTHRTFQFFSHLLLICRELTDLLA